MTLVEVLVSVLILALVLVPFGVAFYGSLNASASNASRQNASLVASSIISRLDAATFSTVGFTASQLSAAVTAQSSYATASGTGYTWTPNVDSDFSAEPLVEVTTAPSFTIGSSATPFAPIMTHVVFARTVYTVYTHIVAEAAAQLGCNGTTTTRQGAYDRVFVEVTWHNGSIGNEVLYQDGLVYPGGLNPLSAVSSSPAQPQITAVTPQTVAGEVTVTWSIPSGWTSSTSCFKVGWADVNQNQYSSGFLTATTSGSACPAVVGTRPPTTFLYNSSNNTGTYCVTGLVQGGASQVYDFYVTAYSPDGTASTESGDASGTAPLGPTITDVTPVSGNAGASVTVTGTGFSTSSQVFEFCSATVNCTGSFSSNCSSATTYCQTVTNCTTTSCTLTAPTLSSSAASGVYFVITETTTTPYVTSAPQAVAQFTYQPTITSTAIASGSGASGSTVTVTGTNLYPYDTAFDFNGVGATSTTCIAGGTSCTVTVPANVTGTSGTAQLQASDNSILSAPYTYTY